MKATVRHRSHRKRRTVSDIVGQATTDEPGRGTASVWLATFKPMPCLFSPVVLRSLCTAGIEQPSPLGPRKARLLVLMETVELRSV